MSSKTVTLLVIVLVASMAVPLVLEDSSADASDRYVSQLDSNGQGLYAQMSTAFASAAESPTDSVFVTYTVGTPMLFSTTDEAKEYALSMMEDAVAAYYLTDPSWIWLWDYPAITDLETGLGFGHTTTTVTVNGTQWIMLVSVSFTLTVPEEFKDDTSTEANEVAEAIAAVKEAAEAVTVSGESVQDRVSSINDTLRGITSATDDEGTVGNIYDALVTKTSSSAGVAAAFTYLCSLNGLTAVTVAGSVLASDGSMSDGFWNEVLQDDSWYAVDCTWNSSTARNCLMVGTTSSVTLGSTSYGFGATHYAEPEQLSSALAAPALASGGVEWPDDSTVIEKYGGYVIVLLIVVVIVVTFVHAIKKGIV
ncbi:MAG: transglutaminase domain-containing protein [Thermoplasmata archaeon]|nr:transglutaminase domain-containing protein [Thermoplasmata archaeon]